MFRAILLSAILLFVGFNAVAQQPPMVYCQGRWVPQGTCGMQQQQVVGVAGPGLAIVNGQQQIVGQQMVGLPSGYQHGSSSQCQNFWQTIGRAGLGGHYNDVRHAEYGGLAGLLVGSLFCPAQNAQQRVVVQQVQQGVPLQQVATQQQVAVESGEIRIRTNNGLKRCYIDDKYVGRARDDADCIRRYGNDSAETSAESITETSRTAHENNRRCPTGKEGEILNWPGHPQHGKFVCRSEAERAAQPK